MSKRQYKNLVEDAVMNSAREFYSDVCRKLGTSPKELSISDLEMKMNHTAAQAIDLITAKMKHKNALM